MTSSYYPVTTNNCYDNTPLQFIDPMSQYSSYQVTNNTKRNYEDDDDDDDDLDLDALRNAALKTLHSNKRKKTNEQSPIDRNSRSTSRSYSSSSRSSYSHSSVSRSSSLSSISSNSLDRHDKDYRFETTTDKQSNGDIDERFPVHTPHDDDNDALIVNCPIQDDDLIIHDEQKNNSNEKSTKKSSYSKERTSNKSSSNEKKRRKDEPRKSPTIERPISITVKLNSEEFDLRQLLKNRRANDSSQNNQRTVQILPKDKNSDVHKTMQNRLSSRRTDKNNQSVEKKYHNNKH